jgi:hypothetical protein
MSPLSFHYIRSIPTDLDLNGPTLSYSTQPTNQSKSHSGIATFVGIATATFPNSADNTGSISYQWYEVGVGAVSNGTNVTGAATTTLTISNLVSPTDNGRRFYLSADYVPSDDTGNAINDGLNSNTASLSVKPFITINTQPTGITTIGTDATATLSVDASLSDTSYGSLSYQWKLNGSNLSDSSTVVGSATSTLNISRSTVGLNTVTVVVSNASANSVASNVVNLNVVAPRNIVKFEAYSSTNQYKTESVNLDDTSSYSVIDTTFGTDYSIIQLYSVEKNTTAKLSLYGSKGNAKGSFTGGEGGYSQISLTLDKEIEYTILGINNNSAIFLYRGSNLIAVVGEGGDAGTSGNGGFGGGINVAGDDGTGSNNIGQGADVPTLSSSGIFGSIFAGSTITLNPGDSIATAPDGGRTLSCSEGSYWMNQGISACSNNSSSKIKYVGRDGTTISNSSLLIRGFKPGYSISNTSGLGVSNGGNGGNGAAGGSGGSAGAGGGGGSGYGDGTFTLLSSSSGGGTGKAKVTIELSS